MKGIPGSLVGSCPPATSQQRCPVKKRRQTFPNGPVESLLARGNSQPLFARQVPVSNARRILIRQVIVSQLAQLDEGGVPKAQGFDPALGTSLSAAQLIHGGQKPRLLSEVFHHPRAALLAFT